MAFEHLAAHDGAVDVALRVHADAFGAGMIGHGRFHVLDERASPCPSFALPMRMPFLMPGQLVRAGVGARLGVGHVDGVVAR